MIHDGLPQRTPRIRAQLNRVVLVVALFIVLPSIALGERLRRGLGRRIALHAIRGISRLLGVRWDVSVDADAAAVDQAVLVPNHRSPLDIPAVLLARPQARFLAAAELFRIPLLAGAMRALDTVPVDRKDPAQSHAQVDSASLAVSQDVTVFAEGGIVEGPLGPLRSGAFRIAIASHLPVLPVAIIGTGDVVGPRRRLLVRPGAVRVHVGAPISTEGLSLDQRSELREKVSGALSTLLAEGSTGTGCTQSVVSTSRGGRGGT